MSPIRRHQITAWSVFLALCLAFVPTCAAFRPSGLPGFYGTSRSARHMSVWFRGANRKAAECGGPCNRLPATLIQASVEDFKTARARISSATFDEWAKEAWRNRDGYTFADDELDVVLESAEGKAAIQLALKLLDKSGVYGEITEKGFRELAVYLDLGQDDFFFDLGSGVGKTVAMAWLELGCAVSCGIELDATRHELGVAALADMMSRYFRDIAPEEEARVCAGSSIRLLQGDILEAGQLPDVDRVFARGNCRDLREATVVWCANLCMSVDFDRQLALKLAQQPQLRAVASLKDWPDGICGFEQTGKRRFEMSWTGKLKTGTHHMGPA